MKARGKERKGKEKKGKEKKEFCLESSEVLALACGMLLYACVCIFTHTHSHVKEVTTL